jgi:hypothetical protein
MQIAVGATRLPKILDKLSPILYSITLECIGSTKLGWLWHAAVECNVKNMYFMQKLVENVEIFI